MHSRQASTEYTRRGTAGEAMPKKIRELKAMLRKAGFLKRAGKGSHTVWKNPHVSGTIVLSGNDGSDARPYQERQVIDAIRKVEDQR